MKNYDLKKNKTYLYFCVFFLLLHLLWVRTNWIFRIHFLDCTRMRMSQIPGVLVDRKSLNYPKSHDIKFSFVLLFAKLFHFHLPPFCSVCLHKTISPIIVILFIPDYIFVQEFPWQFAPLWDFTIWNNIYFSAFWFRYKFLCIIFKHYRVSVSGFTRVYIPTMARDPALQLHVAYSLTHIKHKSRTFIYN